MNTIVRGYETALAQLRQDPARSAKVGGATGPAAPEQAAWTMVSNVLLNLDETLTKE